MGALCVSALVSAVGEQSVQFAWDPSPSPVAGYLIECGLKSGDLPVRLDVGNVTTATVWGLAEGVTYYFAVAAYLSPNLASEPSNEVEYTVPTLNFPTANASDAALLDMVTAKPPAQSTLLVRINGAGSIMPNLAGSRLINGKTYSVTAVPAKGHVFAGWRGGATSSAVKLTFEMRSDLRLEADFIPSPFLPVAGKYTGLFYEADDVRPGAAGLLTTTVTSRGEYSSRLHIGSSRYSFTGTLDLRCWSAKTVKRRNDSPLNVEIGFTSNETMASMSGWVSGGNWLAQLAGNRSGFDTWSNPSPLAGRYTFAILGAGGADGLPTGDGFGAVAVTSAGQASLTGTLADGVRISHAAPVSKAGVWPLHAPLYAGQGLILGWVIIADQFGGDLNAEVSWIKPRGIPGKLYPEGFAANYPLTGSVYARPAGPTNCVFGFTNAVVSFSGGNLAGSFTNFISLGTNHRVKNFGSNSFGLKFSLANGTFTGTATDPSAGKPRAFMGAVLQRQGVGIGFMPVTNQSSRARISPWLPGQDGVGE